MKTNKLPFLLTILLQATHCKGDKQVNISGEMSGEDFIELGVGNTVIINP